jgi:hypothetical protein
VRPAPAPGSWVEVYVNGVRLTATGQVAGGLRVVAVRNDGSAQFEVMKDQVSGTVEFRVVNAGVTETVRIVIGSSAGPRAAVAG